MSNDDPDGYTFFDNKSKRIMRLVTEGSWKDWVVFRHPDGQWVSLRVATVEDWKALAAEMHKTIHKL